MRLTRTTVIPRVEKREQSLLVVIRSPGFQARVRSLQIILLQHVRLLLVLLGREDEVACDYRELVEYEEVRWRICGHVDDVEVWGRVGEGVEVFFGR